MLARNMADNLAAGQHHQAQAQAGGGGVGTAAAGGGLPHMCGSGRGMYSSCGGGGPSSPLARGGLLQPLLQPDVGLHTHSDHGPNPYGQYPGSLPDLHPHLDHGQNPYGPKQQQQQLGGCSVSGKGSCPNTPRARRSSVVLQLDSSVQLGGCGGSNKGSCPNTPRARRSSVQLPDISGASAPLGASRCGMRAGLKL